MTPRPDNDPHAPHPRGRRGGRTTASDQMVRKTFWIDKELDARLRDHASETGQSVAELVRETLRAYYAADTDPETSDPDRSVELTPKTFWIDRETEARLRHHAYTSTRSEAEIVRQALRAAYLAD